MPKEITSAHNPQVKELRALATSKKARQESGCFIVEGWRGLDTLLSGESERYPLEKLVVTRAWENDPRLPTHIETLLLTDPLFGKISDVENAQGILGVVRQKPVPFHILPDAGNYILLDAVRDPGNLGTLVRSAVGAGFDGVLLCNDCVEPGNPKTVRSTMGTFAFIDIWNVTGGDIGELKATGYEFLVTTGTEGENLYGASFGKKTVLVIGSEAHGASESIMKIADRRITIPLEPTCESLNAAIAGSICMFHITRS